MYVSEINFPRRQEKKKLFERGNLKTVYVSTNRVSCACNGKFDGSSSAVAYAWFVFENGYNGNPIIKWFN